MANINLLPWREWERERKKKEFLAQLGMVVVFAGLLVFAYGQMLDGAIEGQEGRNNFMEKKIREVDQKIVEIRDLRKQRADLLSRMRVIQELQGNRSVIVRVFDQVVQTLAKGVHYTELEMTGNGIEATGVAESNNRISALMRNIDGSQMFTSPNLKSIKEDPGNSDYGDQASRFDLSFVQVNPNANVEEED